MQQFAVSRVISGKGFTIFAGSSHLQKVRRTGYLHMASKVWPFILWIF